MINQLLKSPSSVGRYKSTRIDEGSKCCILLAIKITAGTVVGMGEGSPLYDPGSKLYYWEGESNARITLRAVLIGDVNFLNFLFFFQDFHE